MIKIKGLQATWKIKKHDQYAISKLATSLNISISIATVLYNRDIRTKEAALSFLFPTYDENVYDPELLGETTKAIDRIIRSIERREKILICGDYDVDGITATSLLLTALLECDADVNFFLPHRVHDGYGLSPRIIERAKKSDYSLIITVDNGTSAFDALLKAQELKIDVIVTDHHQPKEIPKGAYCIINPHLPNCLYPFKELAGVGVAFKLVHALYKRLNKSISKKIYELFLFGTIADVVPLIEENRYWVSYALQKTNEDPSKSLDLLKRNAKMIPEHILSAEDIAFSLAPQLNALGRLSDPRNGVLFFIFDDDDQRIKIADDLLRFNTERKRKEKEIIEKILTEIKIESIHPHETGCIVKASKEFPAGIIGLIAAKLTQEYNVPTCILTETDACFLKGSCRSIPQCNIFKILEKIDPEILISFGGHSAAAGVCLEKKNLHRFMSQFSTEILKVCTKQDFQLEIDIDSQLIIDELNQKLWKDLHLLEPFGSQNKSPIFYIEKATVLSIKVIKDIHVKLTIISAEKKLNVIFFNRVDIIRQTEKNHTVSVIGKIKQNTWNNKQTLELFGIDITYLN